MPNPALNDARFEQESAANGRPATAGFSPGWGSPADELPPGVFDASASSAGSAAAFQTPGYAGPSQAETMRLSGTMSASAILLLLLVVAAWFGWQATSVTTAKNAAGQVRMTDFSVPAGIWIAMIGAFVLAIVTCFKPKMARFSSPFYALGEGAFLGAISKLYNTQFDGIVLQAVLLTFGVFIMMLVLYATGTIKVTDRLRRGIFAAMGAILLVYLFSFVASLFGSSVPLVNSSSPLGIGLSLVIVGVASMNLLTDFDFIERQVAAGAPRYMEWFGAFGLMLSLVWLYLEILRLLSKLRSR